MSTSLRLATLRVAAIWPAILAAAVLTIAWKGVTLYSRYVVLAEAVHAMSRPSAWHYEPTDVASLAALSTEFHPPPGSLRRPLLILVTNSLNCEPCREGVAAWLRGLGGHANGVAVWVVDLNPDGSGCVDCREARAQGLDLVDWTVRDQDAFLLLSGVTSLPTALAVDSSARLLAGVVGVPSADGINATLARLSERPSLLVDDRPFTEFGKRAAMVVASR